MPDEFRLPRGHGRAEQGRRHRGPDPRGRTRSFHADTPPPPSGRVPLKSPPSSKYPPSSEGRRSGRTPRRRGRGKEQTFRPRIVASVKGRIEKPEEKPIPDVGDNIRIIPLGGVEEIGKNMTVFEVGDDIIVVDAGLQFREEETPGIDYILPNTKYLEEHRSKIKAVVITHGHLDHTGAIPYIMEKIGNPPIYTRLLTSIMIKKRQEEFPHAPPLDLKVVEKNERVSIGNLALRFFSVSHTIPDSMGLIIETPHGVIVHTGDLRVDNKDGVATEAEEKEYDAFKKEKVLALLSDSTNVERPGWQIPESKVHENIEEIIKNARGRLIIGTFSSQLERIMKMIEIAERYGKKVVIEGRSMKINVEIVKYLGLLKAKDDTFISAEGMADYPPDRIVAISTGAQADEFAALVRMSNKTHKYFKIGPGDTVLLSSSIIPGNERAVQKLKDNLARQGAKIVHYRIAEVHASGHANRDEMLWIHNKIRPRFFIPIHGYHHMLRVHAEIARSRGLTNEQIVVPDNGSVIEIIEGGEKIRVLKEKAASNLVLVDGFTIGDVQEVVIRDRQMLSKDGMFVIIGLVNPRNGRLRKSPDIISRGFVYLRESHDLLNQARRIAGRALEGAVKNERPINLDFAKDAVVDAVARFLFQETNKRPIVIPVLMTI